MINPVASRPGIDITREPWRGASSPQGIVTLGGRPART